MYYAYLSPLGLIIDLWWIVFGEWGHSIHGDVISTVFDFGDPLQSKEFPIAGFIDENGISVEIIVTQIGV